uniref:Predicted protein n=1 Tax=Hordeum vulgare subsp. vulgare TaxID=112509 RepID=F2DHD3_HORVV|nr:predicted protein [Hordeum vulgare subsp. vulgare]
MQDQTATTTSSPPSSSDRSSSSKEGMDSDDDIGRVPEFRLGQGGPSTSGREATAAGTSSGLAQSAAAAQASSHRRGRSPADKEHRRLKRPTEDHPKSSLNLLSESFLSLGKVNSLVLLRACKLFRQM